MNKMLQWLNETALPEISRSGERVKLDKKWSRRLIVGAAFEANTFANMLAPYKWHGAEENTLIWDMVSNLEARLIGLILSEGDTAPLKNIIKKLAIEFKALENEGA